MLKVLRVLKLLRVPEMLAPGMLKVIALTVPEDPQVLAHAVRTSSSVSSLNTFSTFSTFSTFRTLSAFSTLSTSSL